MASKHVKYAMISRLKSHATSLQGRAYPTRLPVEVVLPAVAVIEISTIPDHAHSGGTGIGETLLQLTLFAKKELDLQNLKNEIINVVDAFSGTIAGVKIFDCFITGSGDLLDEDVLNLDEYASTIDILITWEM